jgi:hypothetical protein
MKQFDKNAEIIFDQEEPIGLTTDLVMPRRRWFRKNVRRDVLPHVHGRAEARPSAQHSIHR